MKFRAALEDPKALLGVLQVCRSIQQSCIVRLQASRTRFFTTIEAVDGVQAWLGCHTDFLFSDFRCDSHYKEQSITCEVLDLNQLFHTIKQAEAKERRNGKAFRTMIRLARSGARPILKVSMQGLCGQPDATYDIPIRVLSDQEIESMYAPPLEDDRVHVVLPNWTELVPFMDKLKSTSCDCLTFAAQGRPCGLVNDAASGIGEKRTRPEEDKSCASLTIHAEHFLASFALRYESVELITDNKLRHSEEENNEDDRHAHCLDREEGFPSASVTVEVKKFVRVFSALKEMSPTRVSMYLVDQRALVLSAHAVGNTNMVAYVPAKV